MSEIRDYVALRFKIKDSMTDSDLLAYAKEMGYCGMHSDDIYDISISDCEIWIDDNDVMYLDRVLINRASCSDLNICVSIPDIEGIANDVFEVFGEILVENEYRFVCTQWYDGTDMGLLWTPKYD